MPLLVQVSSLFTQTVRRLKLTEHIFFFFFNYKQHDDLVGETEKNNPSIATVTVTTLNTQEKIEPAALLLLGGDVSGALGVFTLYFCAVVSQLALLPSLEHVVGPLRAAAPLAVDEAPPAGRDGTPAPPAAVHPGLLAVAVVVLDGGHRQWEKVNSEVLYTAGTLRQDESVPAHKDAAKPHNCSVYSSGTKLRFYSLCYLLVINSTLTCRNVCEKGPCFESLVMPLNQLVISEAHQVILPALGSVFRVPLLLWRAHCRIYICRVSIAAVVVVVVAWIISPAPPSPSDSGEL